MPDSAWYLGGLTVLVAVTGGCFKYLVVDFARMPAKLATTFKPLVASWRSHVEETLIVAPVAEMCEAYANRPDLVPRSTADEFLAQITFASKFRRIKEAGREMERMQVFLRWAQASCLPIWVLFLLACAFPYGMFFGYYHLAWFTGPWVLACLVVEGMVLALGFCSLGVHYFAVSSLGRLLMNDDCQEKTSS